AMFAITALVTASLMLGVWLLSVIKRDASVVDIFWGLGFVVIAWVSRRIGGGNGGRQLLMCTLVTVWGTRLAGYLLGRNGGAPEDYRYRAMRARHGARFTWVSLYLVFGLQAALLWVVSLPVQAAQLFAGSDHLSRFDAVGTILWVVGLSFEAI